jgi:hypothetical protein
MPTLSDCRKCEQCEASWRCLDCLGRPLLCNKCCKDAHLQHPLHRVERWNLTHFEPAWLWQCGVGIHAGHEGKCCPAEENDGDQSWGGIPDQGDDENNPDPDSRCSQSDPDSDAWESDPDSEETEFIGDRRPPVHDPNGNVYAVFVDISGIHHLSVQYCRCPGHKPNDEQLLDLGFFPATFKRPKTFFTFRALDDFRLDNLESKTSAYQYYAKLRRVTSPAFPHSVPVRPPIPFNNSYNDACYLE